MVSDKVCQILPMDNEVARLCNLDCPGEGTGCVKTLEVVE